VSFRNLRDDRTADEFIRDLEAGNLPYTTLGEFTTPTLFSMPVRIISFIAPNVKILGRSAEGG
jgi:hypothetical protein